MKTLKELFLEVYESYFNVEDLDERKQLTKNYILKEISKWTINSKGNLDKDISISFFPKEFKGNEISPPLSVDLIKADKMGGWELKFGNPQGSDDKEMYGIVKDDPYRLTKTLFISEVIKNEIIPLLEKDVITKLYFKPYNDDNLGNNRLSLFMNILDKVGRDKYTIKNAKNSYKVLVKK